VYIAKIRTYTRCLETHTYTDTHVSDFLDMLYIHRHTHVGVEEFAPMMITIITVYIDACMYFLIYYAHAFVARNHISHKRMYARMQSKHVCTHAVKTCMHVRMHPALPSEACAHVCVYPAHIHVHSELAIIRACSCFVAAHAEHSCAQFRPDTQTHTCTCTFTCTPNACMHTHQVMHVRISACICK
jgi:hypothetical protein